MASQHPLIQQFAKSMLCLGLKSPARVLCAVSGGVDSVALAHLAVQAGFRVGIAHVNHQLRGEESDGDEAFVKEYGLAIGAQVYATRVNTKACSVALNESVQMAARRIRMRFFAEIKETHGFEVVLTGHHKDDHAATILYQLARGATALPLVGIPAKGATLKPLLGATPESILLYAASHGLKWRNDSSNASKLYLRNKLNHDVLPVMHQLNPGFSHEAAEKARVARIYHHAAMQYATQLVDAENLFREYQPRRYAIGLSGKSDDDRFLILQEIMVNRLGFKPGNEFDLVRLSHAPKGKAKNYRRWQEAPKASRRDFQPLNITFRSNGNGELLAACRESFESGNYQETDRHRNFLEIERDRFPVLGNDLVRMEFVEKENIDFQLPNTHYIDHDKLKWFITHDNREVIKLRKPKYGERYQPLGMADAQKLQDILTRMKLPTGLKWEMAVLADGRGIVLAEGHRIAERVKVEEDSKSILKITFLRTLPQEVFGA